MTQAQAGIIKRREKLQTISDSKRICKNKHFSCNERQQSIEYIIPLSAVTCSECSGF